MSARSQPNPDRLGRFRRWLDQRTGLDTLLRTALDEPIPGGPRWAYIFGSGLLFLFLSQVITGVFLALYYVPSAAEAHLTISYIVKQVTGGAFLRSLHSYGASALIVILLLHISQTVLYGSYKGRRELLWLSGGVLAALMLCMAFTGYLLPWDQKAYSATAVGTNMVGEVPLVGDSLRRLLRGGGQMGTLTLSRFFVLHVFFIPAVIFAFLAVHVYLFRKAGPAGPIEEDPIEPRLPAASFYPRQLVMDLFFAVMLVVALGVLAYFFPVTLGPQANPADTSYLPRPEWYYLPVFEWLKFWPGKTVLMGVVVIPAIVIVLFLALPFLDRGLERHPLRRLLAVGGFVLALLVVGGLGVLSHVQDRRDPAVVAQLARQKEEASQYMHEPFVPQSLEPVSVEAAAPTDQLVDQGKKLYTSRTCVGCHGEDGKGTAVGPKLTGIGTRKTAQQIADFLRHPSQQAVSRGMPAFTGSDKELDALVAYLRSLR